jgi:hypothetical protein
VQTGEVVLSTDESLLVGTAVKAGQELAMGARTVLVIRST